MPSHRWRHMSPQHFRCHYPHCCPTQRILGGWRWIQLHLPCLTFWGGSSSMQERERCVSVNENQLYWFVILIYLMYIFALQFTNYQSCSPWEQPIVYSKSWLFLSTLPWSAQFRMSSMKHLWLTAITKSLVCKIWCAAYWLRCCSTGWPTASLAWLGSLDRLLIVFNCWASSAWLRLIFVELFLDRPPSLNWTIFLTDRPFCIVQKKVGSPVSWLNSINSINNTLYSKR